MTAALIFRRQLVRFRLLNLQQALSASKLPLEKFHRLLDLALWGKFLKFESISLFVFFWEFYRVSLDPVFFRLAGLRRTSDAAGGAGHA
jgi:hypothetical protein